MSSQTIRTSTAHPSTITRKTLRAIALPPEHGSWGFLFEPILLGLLVAGTGLGLLFSLAAICLFLTHQPLKIALKDRLNGRRLDRSIWAERFALGYGLTGLVLMGSVFAQADLIFLLPFLMSFPLMLIQLYYDSRNESRAALPEICGAIALGMTAPAIALLNDWKIAPALVLWLLLILRSVPSILYIRARLRLEQNKPALLTPPVISHLLAVGIALAVIILQPASLLLVAPFVILLGRASVGVSPYRKPTKVVLIGVREVIYGLVTVGLLALAYHL